MATSSSPFVTKNGRPRHNQQELQTRKAKFQRGSNAAARRTKTLAPTALDNEIDDKSAGDSNGDDESDHETVPEDAFALSGVKIDERLAGLDDGDMFRHDASQAGAGPAAEDEDDDYAGVDDVSDEDEDEHPHRRSIRRAAERDLIDEFERNEQRHHTDEMTAGMDEMFLQSHDALAQSLGLHAGDGPLDGIDFTECNYGVNMNDDPFLGLASGDEVYKELYDDAERMLDLTGATNDVNDRSRQNSEDSAGTKKRVRFAEPQELGSRSSSMSSEEDATAAFPDLLDALDDPVVRHRFRLEASLQGDPVDNDSIYDFEGEDERMAFAIDDESDSEGDSFSSSDDESDDIDDETDVEDEEQMLASVQRARERFMSEAKPSPPSTPTPAKRSSTTRARNNRSPSTPKSGKGPEMGTFIIDKTRGAMSSDRHGNKIHLHTPMNSNGRNPGFWERSGRTGTTPWSTPRSVVYQNIASTNANPPPFTTQSTLSTLFDGGLDMIQSNDASDITGITDVTTFGPAFYQSPLGEDSETETEDVNMLDFIELSDAGSDTDEPPTPAGSSIMSPSAEEFCDTSFSSSMPSPNTRRHNRTLLHHLDQQRGLVGAFRHNQSFAKHVSSMALHPAHRASTSEANALQKGRRAAGNTPMTPARKKRVSQDLGIGLGSGAGIRKPIASPLAPRRPRSRGGSLSGNLSQTLGQALM